MPRREPDLTVEEVAELTKQSKQTIKNLVAAGRFPGAYRAGAGAINSPIRIPTKALDHYRNTQPLAHAS